MRMMKERNIYCSTNWSQSVSTSSCVKRKEVRDHWTPCTDSVSVGLVWCILLDCKTVGSFLKISKEIGKAWRKSLTDAKHLSPVSLSVFRLVPDLLFDCSRVLEYAKIRTVLQSSILLKWPFNRDEDNKNNLLVPRKRWPWLLNTGRFLQ